MTLVELRRRRGELATQAQTVVSRAIEGSRALTPEEQTQVQSLRDQITEISRQIELFELRETFQPGDGAGEGQGGRLGPDLPDLEPYSLLRALRCCHERRFDGLEGEVHQELAKHRTKPTEGILIPHRLGRRSLRGRERRGDVTTTTVAGSIPTILSMDFIDILRNRMVMARLGATTLSGLTGGHFTMPKQTQAATAYHVGEDAAATASNMAIDIVTWQPRTVTVRSRITRQTIVQTSLDVEARVRNDMGRTLGLKLDAMGLFGSGAGNEPTGVGVNSSVPTIALGTNGGAPTYDLQLDMEELVATANADIGELAYVTNNKVRKILKKTRKLTGATDSEVIWEKGAAFGEGEVNGYRALATNQMPSNLTKGTASGVCSAEFFGYWPAATYGMWTGVDVLVDPYTGGSAGALNIYIHQDYDFQLAYTEAFVKCLDILTA